MKNFIIILTFTALVANTWLFFLLFNKRPLQSIFHLGIVIAFFWLLVGEISNLLSFKDLMEAPLRPFIFRGTFAGASVWYLFYIRQELK